MWLFDLFKKSKSQKEIERDISRHIRKTKLLSQKITKEINTNIGMLKKYLKSRKDKVISSSLDMESKRISKKIILLQRRREKQDQKLERIESLRDVICDAQVYNDISMCDVGMVLENQLGVMQESKEGMAGIENQKLRFEVLREELEEDLVNENEVEELADDLINQTMDEIME